MDLLDEIQKECLEGLVSDNTNIDEYRNRLEEELDVIRNNTPKMVKLIALLNKLTEYAKTNGIKIRLRGAANGSLILYALGITDVDPIKYRLIFERFYDGILPNVTIDVIPGKKKEIEKYIKELKKDAGVNFDINVIEITSLSTGFITKPLNGFEPTSFNDAIIAMNLARPGANNNLEELAGRKADRRKIKYIDNTLEDILEETYGLILYQEQIMMILNRVGGYTLTEANRWRLTIRDRSEEEQKALKVRFDKEGLKRGYTTDKLDLIYKELLAALPIAGLKAFFIGLI